MLAVSSRVSCRPCHHGDAAAALQLGEGLRGRQPADHDDARFRRDLRQGAGQRRVQRRVGRQFLLVVQHQHRASRQPLEQFAEEALGEAAEIGQVLGLEQG